MSTEQQVIITYSAPLVFLSTDHWKQIYASLLSQLPFRNLHWKSTSRNALRSIQELNARVISLDTLQEDQAASQVPQTVLDKPLLNTYFFICEDSEAYRTTTRKQIKDWHASVSQRKNQEWLLVHVVRPDQNVAQARLFQMKTSVLDKIKADFNTDKKDRCVQLVWSADRDHPTIWADLVTKVKEGVLSAFDAALTQREEEVRRSEGQKQMPGWNFCTFFILKESVANSLEGIKLGEDALQQYYDLETTFFQVLREKNLSWFGPLINPTPTDNFAPLLSVTRKPYRDLILGNTISVFDFRVYLLARQCKLLSMIGDMEALCRKATTFLNTFARTLRDVDTTLPLCFIESWIYSSALSVVDQSNEWARSIRLENHSLSAFNAAKGELVELARHQLDILGIASGFLPRKSPFSLALPPSFDPVAKDVRGQSSSVSINPELLSALEEQTTLYDLYANITNRAIELYTNAGRRKFAVRLHGSLAALDVHRGRLGNALQTFSSLPAHYSPLGWTSLEGFMLSHALDVHAALEKPKDREWMHILIHFLKAYVGDMGKDLLLDDEDSKAHIQALVMSLKDAANELDTDRPCSDHPAFSVSLVDHNAMLAGNRDGSLLKVRVQNQLPCYFPADKVEIKLTGRENSTVSFATTVSQLAPGLNELTLFCPSSAAGTYSLSSSHIGMSRLLFEWSHHPKASKQTRAKTLPKLVYVPRDLKALDVKLKQPPIIELGTPSKLMVLLSAGRNTIATAVVKFGAPSGVQFEYTGTELIGEDHFPFRTDEHSLTFLDLEEGQTVIAAVPHSDASAHPQLRVDITVEYVTTAEPDITRTLSLSRIVTSSLPIGINVEDFFRGNRLFTVFTLSTKSHQHIRVRSVQLRSQSEATGVKVTACVAQKPGIVTLTPAQSGKFLFQMDSQRGQVHEGLELRIAYRVLREEVEGLIHQAVSEVIAETPPLESLRQDLADQLVQTLEADATWVELYSLTGELSVPGIVPCEDDKGSALRRVSEILNRKRTPSSFGEWRDLIIPLDVPQKHILASARLQILNNPFSATEGTSGKFKRPLYAGQPISALLTIQTSFHWAPPEDMEVQSYTMRYDIEDLMHDWLVSGRKRGDFVAADGGVFTTQVTLIALHHGELVLPRIGVSALPLQGETRMRSSVMPSCETHQVHGAEKVLVLPRGGRSTFVVNMGTSTGI